MNIEEEINEIVEDLNQFKSKSKIWLNAKELASYLDVSLALVEMW